MAETQEKRTDDFSSDNKINSKNVGNQSGSVTQNNMQTGGASTGAALDTKEILQQAKNTAGQAYEKVTEQASSQISTQKENLARGLSSVADGIRQMGENLRDSDQQTPLAGLTAKYGDSLASQVEDISNYLERKDLRELVRDIEVFARRNPAIFIGGAFALGVAAARFLKSSNPNQALMRRPRRDKAGFYIADQDEGVYLPEDLSKKVGLTDDTSKTSNFGSTNTNQSFSDHNTSSATPDSTMNKTTESGNTAASSSNDVTSPNSFSTNKGG